MIKKRKSKRITAHKLIQENIGHQQRRQMTVTDKKELRKACKEEVSAAAIYKKSYFRSRSVGYLVIQRWIRELGIEVRGKAGGKVMTSSDMSWSLIDNIFFYKNFGATIKDIAIKIKFSINRVDGILRTYLLMRKKIIDEITEGNYPKDEIKKKYNLKEEDYIRYSKFSKEKCLKFLNKKEALAISKTSDRITPDDIVELCELLYIGPKKVQALHEEYIKFKYADEHHLRWINNLRKGTVAVSKAVEDAVYEGMRTQIPVLAMKTLPRPPKYSIKDKPRETVMLMLNDHHIGRKTESFNIDVYSERLNILRDSVLRIIEIMRSGYALDDLVIFFLGDIIDNDTLFPTHPWEVDINVAAQVGVGQAYLRDFLKDLLQSFRKIDCYCVPGNHGRLGRFSDPRANWDKILYMFLETSFNKSDRVNFHIAQETNFMPVVVEKHGFGLIHGGDIKMYNQTPTYGCNQALERWGRMHDHSLMDMGAPKGLEYLCMGHFHSFERKDHNKRQFIVGGTMVTDDLYSNERIKLTPSNTQFLCSIHESKGITWSFNIDVV